MRKATTEKSVGAPGTWIQRARPTIASRDDSGLSMVELIVALLLITIILLSGAVGIEFGLTSSNQQRLKVEATNLAVSTMEQNEELASSLSIGSTSTSTTVNGTTFTVVAAVKELDQNGSQLTSACTSNSVTQSQQIWQVAVTVTWPQMDGAPPISEATEVAPGQTTAQDLSNGELAVGVVGAAGQPLTTPVNFTVTPVGTGAYSPPLGQVSPAGTSFNTGTNGCGIVTGLSTTPGWTYTVALVSNPGLVSNLEASDLNPAGDPTVSGLQALAGQVTHVAPPFQMAPGIATSVVLQPVTYSCDGPIAAPSAGTPDPSCYVSSGKGFATPISTLPITVGNPSLPSGQYTFGLSGTSVVSSALLYPYSLYDVWAGDMAQSSPGYSAPASGVPFYSVSPLLNESPSPVTLSGASTVTVPTYDLSVQVTAACANTSLVATEQAGSALSFTLNSGAVSASGIPLGQYLLSSAGTCTTLTSAHGLYVWITPTGVYEASAQMTSPYLNGLLIAPNASVQVTE